MTDIIDQAQKHSDETLALALKMQSERAAAAVKPAPVGYCLNIDCGEDFSDPRRLFCGPACAERFEAIEKQRYNN